MDDSVESIVEKFPVGSFHYRLFIICGFSIMCDAMEATLLSFLSSCAGADWNLSNSQEATIVSIVFLGEIVGSAVWGPLSDQYGRRRPFLASCAVVAIAGLLSSFAPSFEWLLFLRFLVGFGVGGNSIAFDLLAEFLPNESRGTLLMNANYFRVFGSMFVAAMAWATLSHYSWRWLTFIAALPVLVSLILGSYYLPESLTWLVVKGKNAEAEELLRQIGAECGVDTAVQTISVRLEDNQKDKASSFWVLFESQTLRSITLKLFAIWFVEGLAYYGIVQFVSRLYMSESDDDDGSDSCNFNYGYIFINSSAELPGVFFSGLIIDRWGRRLSLIFLFGLSGFTALLMGLTMPPGALLSVAFFGRMSIKAAASAIWIMTPEIYPTAIRATGHGACFFVSRFGALTSPYLVDSSLSNVIIGLFFCIFDSVAMSVSFLLPETAGFSMGSMFEFTPQKKAPLLPKNEEQVASNPIIDGNI